MNTFTLAGRFGVLASIAAFVCAPSLGLADTILKTGANYAAFGQAGVSIAAPYGTTISNSLGTSLSLTSITGTEYVTTVVGTASDIPAGNDIATAYTALTAMPATSLKASSDILGSSAGSTVLAPGVYKYDTSAQLNSTLTLDAQGRNGVVWVFQIGTTLTTGPGSQVVFTNLGTNNGTDNGVFWAVGNSATLGSGSLLVGNVLTGTAEISLGTTAQLHGGAYAHAAVTMAGTNAIDTTVHGGLDGGVAYDMDGAAQITDVSPTISLNSAFLDLPVILSLNGSFIQTVAILDGTATLTYLLSEDGKGRLSGSGTLSFVSVAQSFTAPLEVTGKVTRSGIVSRVQLHTRSSLRHLVNDNSDRTPFDFKGEHQLEFDANTLTLAGRTTVRAGLGRQHDAVKLDNDVIALPSGIDGSWILTLSAPDQKGNGTALLSLVDGTTLSFRMTSDSGRNGSTRYKLKGEGEARGSTLIITLDAGRNVTDMNGNVLGQPMKLPRNR
ncbi:MAG: ice-binding family protein [Opitutaceae bacterium]|jgi:type VI secretion system secreted protein VgrG